MNTGTATPDEPTACCPDMIGEMRSGFDRATPCPMATMCGGAMGKMRFGFLLAFPGIALLVGGALILFEPRVLVWLIAGTAILLGVGLLTAALVVGRSGTRWWRA